MESVRSCLLCGASFVSSGSGNRLCKKCNRRNQQQGKRPAVVV